MTALGIDLGGTRIKSGLFKDGKIIRESICNTAPSRDYKTVLMQIRDEAGKLLSEGKPEFIGIGSPGIIDRKNGVVLYSNNFGWENAPLCRDLEGLLDIPVRMANDAHCGVLEEALYGAGAGWSRVAMLTVGTGVGGGYVKDGRLETDDYGSMAYIFGHSTVELKGEPCNCGRRGCLEGYASATALAKRGRKVLERECSAKEVFEAAGEGDLKAGELVLDFLEYLGEGAVNMANILRPQLIVMGGGVLASYERILPVVNSMLKQGVYGYEYAPVKAVRAQLGDRAGIAGAASLI